MAVIFKMAFKEMQKKKTYTLLLFLVCIMAMNTVVTAITNTTAGSYQQKIFERNLSESMKDILHLHYLKSSETQDFANEIPKYLQYISGVKGVRSVGQFERTGVIFEELQKNDEYKEINLSLLQGSKYENHPEISDILFVDEELLTFVKIGLTEYKETESGNLPIIVSKAFEDVLPIGTDLTEGRSQTIYEVIGYLPMGKQWVDQNDLIRFPLESMDGCFIAPFCPEDKTDILTQLSCLHNTYVIAEDANLDYLKTKIEDYSLSHGFHATAKSLSEEYGAYRDEVKIYQRNQLALAVFISVMAVSSIISMFTTNAILKQRQYGIYIANGFTKKEIELGILIEILLLVIPSTILVWIVNLIQLVRSNDMGIELFRDVLLTAHWEYTLPICLLAALVVGLVSAILPALKISKYQPNELIGGLKHGID